MTKLLSGLLMLLLLSCGGAGGQVDQGGAHPVVLTWDAPTQYEDGSFLNPVVELKEYRLYYGKAPHSYTQVLLITNPGTAMVTQTITLTPGTYFFTVTATTHEGLESAYSNEVQKEQT